MSIEQSQSPIENVETVSGPQIDPYSVWLNIGQEVGSSFHKDITPRIVEKYLRGVQSVDELSDSKRTELDKQIRLGQAREEVFAKAVVKTLQDTMQDKPDAEEFIVLFDLDETLSHRGVFDNSIHLIRPAAVPLMRMLINIDPRISFGIVTSRGQGYLEEEIQNPSELAELLPFMDKDHIYSCRDKEVRDYSTKYVDEADKSKIYGSVMDTKRRIAVCEGILTESPKVSVILVNDYAFPDMLPKVLSDQHLRLLPLDTASMFVPNIG